MDLLRNSGFPLHRVCDDLSLTGNDAPKNRSRRCWKAVSKERPDNVILYATSNRRHLLARHMIEHGTLDRDHPGEAVEEEGVAVRRLWSSGSDSHRCSQTNIWPMVRGYCGHFRIKSTTTN